MKIGSIELFIHSLFPSPMSETHDINQGTSVIEHLPPGLETLDIIRYYADCFLSNFDRVRLKSVIRIECFTHNIILPH